MDMLGVTFIAVSKVVVGVLVGVFSTNAIPNCKTSVRDFSYLISMLLTTCLTVSNTARSVDVEVVISGSVLVLFSMVLIASGLLWGLLLGFVFFRLNPKYSGIPEGLRKDVRLDVLYEDVILGEGETATATTTPARLKTRKKPKKVRVPYVALILSDHLREVEVEGSDIVNSLEVPDQRLEDYAGYTHVTWIACSTQNGVTLPLSLIANIALSISFIDMEQATTYIFVFTMTYMLYLWSACPAYITSGVTAINKQRLIRERVKRHKIMMTRCDATTQTLSLPVHQVLNHAGVEMKENADGEARPPPCLTPPRSPVDDNPVARSPRRSVSLLSSSSGRSDASAATQAGCEAGNRPPHRHSVTSAAGNSLLNSFTQTESNVALAAAVISAHNATGITFQMPGSRVLMTPAAAAEYAFTMSTAEQLPYDWATAGLIRVRYEGDIKALKPQTMERRLRVFAHWSWALCTRLMTAPPFLSVVIGLFIGLIPPVRRLFVGGPLEMVMDAVTLIGQASIPSSLILLGANLVGNTSASAAAAAVAEASASQDHYNAGQNTDTQEEWRVLGEDGSYAKWYDEEHAGADWDVDTHETFSLHMLMKRGHEAGADSVAPMAEYDDLDNGLRDVGVSFMESMRRFLTLRGVRHSFVWSVIVLRLFVGPAVSFCLLVLLINTMPFLFGGAGTLDKTLIMVLIVELASPTAINGTVLINVRQFMTYPWSKMLFYQYIICSATLVMWASIGLTYVASLE